MRQFLRFGVVSTLCLLIVGLLPACGDKAPPPPDATAIAKASELQPSDPALAAIYERSCRTCHSHVEAKAPLAGYAPHWKPRLQQGMPVLLAHVRDGFQGMPARGYCNDCSDSDYEALIHFMAGQ